MLNQGNFELMTDDDCRALASLVGKEQGVYQKRGFSPSAARHEAANAAGALFNPPVTGAEILSRLAKFGAQTKPEKAEEGDDQSFTVLYRQWAEQNDEIASDKQLAHFAQCTAGAFYYARKKLGEEGYVIERNNGGWLVITRPSTKKAYTEAEVRAMISKLTEQLMSQFGK